VFTSPLLTGTEGVLHVSGVYLNGLRYENLEIELKDGMVKSYCCTNYEQETENRKYIKENVLKNRDTLPLGEFAIGTNTTAYVMGRKYGIEAKLPILIAEKTGPHFALGDTCYSMSEEVVLHNPDGKEIIAKENECSLLRHTDISKAYFNCHTDITIPYEELGDIVVHTRDGRTIELIREGRFVLPGTEALNEVLSEKL
jgi:leucyl aminopeptidase (aminopeptidase T)